MNSERIGGSFETFLEGEGIRDEVDALAQKRVFAWRIQQAMKAAGMTQTGLAGADAHQPDAGGSRLNQCGFRNSLICQTYMFV